MMSDKLYTIPPHRKRPKGNLFHLRPLLLDLDASCNPNFTYEMTVSPGWFYDDHGQDRINKLIGWQIGMPSYREDWEGRRRWIHDRSVRLAMRPDGQLFVWYYPDRGEGIACPTKLTLSPFDRIRAEFTFTRNTCTVCVEPSGFLGVEKHEEGVLSAMISIPVGLGDAPITFMYELGPYIDGEHRTDMSADLLMTKYPMGCDG